MHISSAGYARSSAVSVSVTNIINGKGQILHESTVTENLGTTPKRPFKQLENIQKISFDI